MEPSTFRFYDILDKKKTILGKPMSDNHSIRKESTAEKRNCNFSRVENVISSKTIETVDLMESDVNTDTLTQRKK